MIAGMFGFTSWPPLPSRASDAVACATVLVSVVTAVSVVNVGMWVNVMRVGFKIRSRRLHMIFPISGPEARGVVSIEAKKRKGRHEFKLLAVDIVGMSDGAEQRVFLEGDDARYDRGGILSELRDPFLKVTAAETMYEREDDEEELQLEEDMIQLDMEIDKCNDLRGHNHTTDHWHHHNTIRPLHDDGHHCGHPTNDEQGDVITDWEWM